MSKTDITTLLNPFENQCLRHKINHSPLKINLNIKFMVDMDLFNQSVGSLNQQTITAH